MFFAGRLPRPPWETKTRVDAMVKRFDRMRLSNYGDRFKFNTIQSRYARLIELWERSLRSREEGRPGPLQPRARGSVTTRDAETEKQDEGDE
jgi:hypothetical protein